MQSVKLCAKRSDWLQLELVLTLSSCSQSNKMYYHVPADTWRNNNVIMTLKRRRNVVLTLWWRYCYAICPLNCQKIWQCLEVAKLHFEIFGSLRNVPPSEGKASCRLVNEGSASKGLVLQKHAQTHWLICFCYPEFPRMDGDAKLFKHDTQNRSPSTGFHRQVMCYIMYAICGHNAWNRY